MPHSCDLHSRHRRVGSGHRDLYCPDGNYHRRAAGLATGTHLPARRGCRDFIREAKAKHAYEAILLTADGKLSDGITSNIYMVRDGKLLTPGHEAGIVQGITRGVVLELAREMGLQVVEGLFEVADVADAQEMFLTSSTREVVPIARIDGRPI